MWRVTSARMVIEADDEVSAAATYTHVTERGVPLNGGVMRRFIKASPDIPGEFPGIVPEFLYVDKSTDEFRVKG